MTLTYDSTIVNQPRGPVMPGSASWTRLHHNALLTAQRRAGRWRSGQLVLCEMRQAWMMKEISGIHWLIYE